MVFLSNKKIKSDKGGIMMEEKSCWDCGYHKQYVNRRKMAEQNTDEVIWLNICENVNIKYELTDLSEAKSCQYYDDDSWMK